MKYELGILLFEVTQRCNAKCKHCGSRCEIDSPELLTKEDILDTLRDVKENFGTDVMINISGGEPLMRQDLFEITKEITNLGFDWGLVTNGMLITDETIQKMIDSGMKTITISVDGLPKTHAMLRGVPENTYDRLKENLKKMIDTKAFDHVQVTFTVNKYNLDDLEPVYNDLNTIGLDSFRVGLCDAIGRAEDNKDLILDREELKRYYKILERIRNRKETPVYVACPHFFGANVKDRDFVCFAGKIAASILYNGDIFVCPDVPRQKDLIEGNIHQVKFSDVWRNGFKIEREGFKKEYCDGCKYYPKCQGDSLHTWDFENNKPKWCYKDIHDVETAKYLEDLKRRYAEYSLVSVMSDKIARDIYIEPDAYEDIKRHFNVGKKKPLSLYEQEMALIGFKVDTNYVIKYVTPINMKRVAGDLGFYRKSDLAYALSEADIARKNFAFSDDKDDYIGRGLQFLGFIHSHPVQTELQYSIGDEKLHSYFVNKFGDYVGILINPSEDLIGAYYGKKIKQGNLRIITDVKEK